MGAIKKLIRNLPLRTSFVLFTACFALLAVFLSEKTRDWANAGIWKESPMIFREMGKDIGTSQIKVFLYDSDYVPLEVPAQAAMHLRVYQGIRDYAPLFWGTVCILASSLVFYRLKLQEPIRLLKDASAHISDNDLDFHISREGSDELSALCRAFEEMRQSLADSMDEMAETVEQRKRLNDAYTHELRTPAAVLRGCADMILKYLPARQMPEEELLHTVRVMSEHIARISAFTDSMNVIQRLDAIMVTRTRTQTGPFLGILEDSAAVLCRSRKITPVFQAQVSAPGLLLDTDAVSQVFDNLLGNALRFAKSTVWITCLYEAGMLRISFADDGDGFTEPQKKKAGLCYYSGKDSAGGHHFGLGLHICTLLCEKHGGRLSIANGDDGGALVTASFKAGRCG